jgi:hypothetical protein
MTAITTFECMSGWVAWTVIPTGSPPVSGDPVGSCFDECRLAT